MKFAFSITSVIAHTSSILLLGFSLPLVAQISFPEHYPECKILTPKTFNSIDEFSKIVSVPKNCFTYMINQHNKAMLSQDRMKYYHKAMAYEKSGEKQKAISNWTEYIDGNDSFIGADVYISRGNLNRDLGDKEKAINDYKAADKVLQLELNAVFGNGSMGRINEKKLNKVRTELSQLGVSLPEPNLTTAKILKSIAKIEVERALASATLNPQHPMIRQFDAKLQDLYKQLENAQPQPLEGIEKSIISNAAYRKIEDLKVQESQLTKKITSKHPERVIINSQIKQLEALINRNKI